MSLPQVAGHSTRPRITVTDAFGSVNAWPLFALTVVVTGGPSGSA
ncbi:MAG TPA: hypothetical protein VHF01_09915 [Candidatus Acidoferrum sp.]|nr:hypothetical protein [Candidatus Acidoferrum sp.]